MKKLLLTLGLAVITSLAHADGTINPLNTSSTRFKIDSDGNGIGDRNATAADGFRMAIYYGPAGSSPFELTMYPDFMSIGTVDGLFTGLPRVLAIPGTEDYQVISLQMRVCNPLGWYGETAVKQVTLGHNSGPGTIVWSTTASPSMFLPIQLQLGPSDNCIPEPSTLALGALGVVLSLSCVRQRSAK